jgi:benzylsuccinate CoA-transferase BbsF subunit
VGVVNGGPLAGVRVLDLGWTWAGPYGTMILTDLGADVVKVESSRRIDVLRWSGAFSDGVRDFERGGYYSACNRGKQSVSIDLKHPQGRELVLRLAARCDVAIENFSPGVLTRLGLGWDELSAANPQLVLVSLSAYGGTGPEREYVAYGDHLLYASGMASATGVDGDPPTPIGTFYGDPVAGLYGALALLAGLEERERTGTGRHFDYGQVQGLLAVMPGALARTSAGESDARIADKSPDMAPHGFYRCPGDDAWVAIAVESDGAWADLRARLGRDGVDVPAWPTLAERKAHEPELDALVSAWTAARSPWQVTTACQELGVAAYPLMSAPRLLWNQHLHERGFFAWVTHPVAGPAPIPGVVFRVGEDGARVRGPAPTLGQHNHEVLTRVLEMPDDEIASLVECGALA